MVRLEHVNKYFFRRRKNEIHAINDTSLNLEGQGLIALLGPSGCGKTTLLNAIGGLDKINQGEIYVNGQRISRRTSGKVDQIRTLNVGYIFQNYNLVDSMTVFENVAVALQMIGMKDKEEIRSRVNSVLEKVGMYRYRNRYADMLSGGERQRVGIARAIVKNPAIVIADEPTGNLDSRNTLEVMNIIKSVAEERLVILVTHEEKLANFYADRIIRIKDGRVVSDEVNTQAEGLDYRVENKIYLQDIPDHKRLNTDGFKIDFYNEGGSADLNIVIRRGNIYIQSRSGNNAIEVVDDQSAIELIDDHYREIGRDEQSEQAINLKTLDTLNKKKYTSILNPATLIKRGFRMVTNYPILKKILLLGFFISAAFITYAVTMTFGTLHITDDRFTTEDKDYLTVVGKHISVEDYEAYEQDEQFAYVMPGNSIISMSMRMDQFYQTKDAMVTLTGSLSDRNRLKKTDMVYGKLPETRDEIVVDRMLLKNTISEYMTQELGLTRPKDFLGKTVEVTNLGEFRIVGISDLQTPCIYTDKSQFIELILNATGSEDEDMYVERMEDMEDMDEEAGVAGEILDFQLKTEAGLIKGDWPERDYEVIVNEKNMEDKAFKIGKEISTKVNGHKLKVVGYYIDPKDSDYYLVNSNTMRYKAITENKNMTVCPVNKEASLHQFKEEKVNVYDVYQRNHDKYLKEQRGSMTSMLVMAGVILAISFIEIFLMIRASFLSRIKEVGVYRAIGVKKRDIYKMFSGEIIAISTIASLPGMLFMSLVISRVVNISAFEDMFMINPGIMLVCLIVIYGLNLIFGLLPVWRTIRKTPAAILSRTDVN
ncbi:MAG: ABC transporter ATP-binding protein/permease [Firmicutes bacterium]|nr:ABC transporter ATP-binding protein/permease [Bacillota bacterium]